ncbi:MAG: 5'/3'-nucleotidase SurE [Bacillota bacterium]
MYILLTNDDGIMADGIQSLRKACERIADVVMVAPDRERSASGHGITMHKPLRVEESSYGNSPGFAVSGTPADCVKLALEKLLVKTPDLVISGINKGSNLGTDVLYSGTVSGALEAIINRIPSIAVSLENKNKNKDDYRIAANFAAQLAKYIIKRPLPVNTFLNVNVPDLGAEAIKGVKVVKIGSRRYVNTIEERKDPRGRSYYWLSGNLRENLETNTDIWAIANNYIAISPLHYDLTNFKAMTDIEAIQDYDFKIK